MMEVQGHAGGSGCVGCLEFMRYVLGPRWRLRFYDGGPGSIWRFRVHYGSSGFIVEVMEI